MVKFEVGSRAEAWWSGNWHTGTVLHCGVEQVWKGAVLGMQPKEKWKVQRDVDEVGRLITTDCVRRVAAAAAVAQADSMPGQPSMESIAGMAADARAEGPSEASSRTITPKSLFEAPDSVPFFDKFAAASEADFQKLISNFCSSLPTAHEAEVFAVGERVEIEFDGRWYAGAVRGLPPDDKNGLGRYSVQCDADAEGCLTYNAVLRPVQANPAAPYTSPPGALPASEAPNTCPAFGAPSISPALGETCQPARLIATALDTPSVLSASAPAASPLESTIGLGDLQSRHCNATSMAAMVDEHQTSQEAHRPGTSSGRDILDRTLTPTRSPAPDTLSVSSYSAPPACSPLESSVGVGESVLMTSVYPKDLVAALVDQSQRYQDIMAGPRILRPLTPTRGPSRKSTTIASGPSRRSRGSTNRKAGPADEQAQKSVLESPGELASTVVTVASDGVAVALEFASDPATHIEKQASLASVASDGVAVALESAPETFVASCVPITLDMDADIVNPSQQVAVTHSHQQQSALEVAGVCQPNNDVEKRAYARWMLESSLARAERERMMQGVQRAENFAGPTWMDDAARFGGSSMSVKGFNAGYGSSREFNSPSNLGADRLERNFQTAVEVLEVLHKPYSYSPASPLQHSNPMTGWVSWWDAEPLGVVSVPRFATPPGHGADESVAYVDRDHVASPLSRTLFNFDNDVVSTRTAAPLFLSPDAQELPAPAASVQDETPEGMVQSELEKLRQRYQSSISGKAKETTSDTPVRRAG